MVYRHASEQKPSLLEVGMKNRKKKIAIILGKWLGSMAEVVHTLQQL